MALATSSPNARPPPFGSQQQQTFLKPASPFHPQPAAPGSSSTSGFGHFDNQAASNNSNSHHVGFASLGFAPPSTLGFGFASSAPRPTTFGTGSTGTPPMPTPNLTTPIRSQQQQGVGARRRRREESSDDEATADDSEGGAYATSHHRRIKKMRSPSVALVNNSSSTSLGSPLAGSSGSAHRSGDEVMRQLGRLWVNFRESRNGEADHNRCLAPGHMDKAELLNVLGSLMTQSPNLVPQVQALLPRPTPATFMALLPALETAVLSCIPAQSRPEYVMNRVKSSLEGYVAEARSALQSFNVAAEHPSTSFAFLQGLTASLQRLERALPPANTALNSLVPTLFNAWHLFLSRLSASVNQQGKILGADFVQRMFDDVQVLCALPPQQGSDSHRFMVGVAERLNKEIGWLASNSSGNSRRSRSSTADMEEL